MSHATPASDAPSKPPTRFRRTRIAVSAFFGALTVALCVLWVRSYSYYEYIGDDWTPGKWIHIESVYGGLAFNFVAMPVNPPQPIKYGSSRIDPSEEIIPMPFGFSGELGKAWTVRPPYWFLVAVTGVISFVMGFVQLKQFSLRTLFIATTLVAIVLGLCVLDAPLDSQAH
jgi:hypothetical protein